MITDAALQAWVCGLIEVSKLKSIFRERTKWQPGEKLKLLFAGYNGVRNTGADVRVHEMLRQFKHILVSDNVKFSVLTQNFRLTQGYFEGVDQVRLPDMFPMMLFREVSNHDGVVACEGSTFKSSFANALATMMVEVLAIASAQNKLSVAYGSEAGEMDGILAQMCRRYCSKSLIVTRNEQSQSVLAGLGLSSKEGTDTAWTFQPNDSTYAQMILRREGWDGKTPVLCICAMNPFWWPVKPSIFKFVANKLRGDYADSQYRSVYFHKSGSDVTDAYNRYLNAIAGALDRFRKERKIFIVLMAMEQLDNDSCRKLSARIGGVPIFSSERYDMFELVSLLQVCNLIVSSRYHGIVCSMTAGVPSAGLYMDERIRNLMQHRGHQALLIHVEDVDLEDKLFSVLHLLETDREEIRYGIARAVSKHLELMGRMGIFFAEYLRKKHPDFPLRSNIHSWEDYLPPLAPMLQKFLVGTL